MLQLLSAIKEMHNVGIVHRDLNPGNIFLHFPDIPFSTSPQETTENEAGKQKRGCGDIAGKKFSESDPMARVTGCQLKIIDFNHSLMFNLENYPQDTTLGQRFEMEKEKVGTPLYRAPEMLRFGKTYSESIDLWSAGCCIYFMLTGKPPFPETQT